jgi:hypothetical protein
MAMREKPPAEDFRKPLGFSAALPNADRYALVASSQRLMNIRGDRRFTFPNEVASSRLFSLAIAQVEEFTADTFFALAEQTAL